MRTISEERRRRAGVAVLAAALVLVGLTAAPALAATEAQQGAQRLRKIEAGTVSCGSLKTGDFDHIGEYVMERMLGSASAHEAMNRQMAAMMGSRGETQAHVFMGQRFAGCAAGRAPNAFGAMMGMMGAGMMGSVYGSGGSTMMGSSYGGMMGSGSGSSATGDGWSRGDTVMVALMGLLLALALVALATWKPWRQNRAGTPLETLQSRYARGEIDQREFDRRRQALGGTT
jgi:uncharacterized membrane protein